MSDLLNIIQSSEDEMYNYLNYIEAYKIDGEKFYGKINILIN